MISRPTLATSSTLHSPPRPSRSHSSSSRPNTPSRQSMATQTPRQPRTKAVKPPPTGSDDALFALLGIPVPAAKPEVVSEPDVPKKAQKKGLLTLTQPQMAAIRAETSEQPRSTPTKSSKGRQAFANNSGTESDAPGTKPTRARGGKGRVKATHVHPGTDSDGFVPRPKHSRHKSEPPTQVAEEVTVQNAPSIPPATWDGPPRLDRELEPFAVDSMVLPDARTQALLEPLESSKKTPSRSSSARRSKQTKPKRDREKERGQRTDDSDAFETSSLSRSLPASNFAPPGGKHAETEADVWDMPVEVGKGAGDHALTWQQALQNSKPESRNDNQTPTKRPNRKAAVVTATRQQPARAAKGARRYSLDHTAAPPAGAGHGFVYPGMNANRAPQVQTPTKAVPASALQGALEPAFYGQAAGHGQAQGSALFKQYAGPTFHNSPLAGSLPRPNNDDF